MRNYTEREKRIVICKDCSSEVLTNANRILRCKPCAIRKGYPEKMLNYEWRLNKLIANAKHRSKKGNLDFNLTLPYIVELWKANNGNCCVTGRKLDLSDYGEKGQINPYVPSIDRIVPKLGYVIGNVRLITYHANVAISEFGLESLIYLSKDILRQNNNSEYPLDNE